jgi:hypothetical protein
MLAHRARPSASLACHPALRAQSLPSPVPCDSRAKGEENCLPPFSTRRALFVRSFAQERKLTPLLSEKRIPSRPDQLRQPVYLQLVAGAATRPEILTSTFPAPSALFVRSFTKERKSTPLLSCDCARFCRNSGVLTRAKNNSFPNNEFRGCYSRSAKKSEGLSEQP